MYYFLVATLLIGAVMLYFFCGFGHCIALGNMHSQMYKNKKATPLPKSLFIILKPYRLYP